MPSPKTAEAKEEVLVKIKAKRTFAVDYSTDELKKMQTNDKQKRSFIGHTKLIEAGQSVEVTKEVAAKLTESGAAIPDYG